MKKQFSIIVSYFEKFGSDQHATQKIKISDPTRELAKNQLKHDSKSS